MKKKLKREAFLAVIIALVCQILEMYVFTKGGGNFAMNFLTVVALAFAIILGVRSATVVEHKREGEAWKTIVKEELHEELPKKDEQDLM